MFIIASAVLVLSVFYLILVFLVAPSSQKHPAREELRGSFIAHRGLHSNEDEIPENSLPAFARAVMHGFAIEIDIHLTKDNQIVVFHDSDTKRMCGTAGIVEEMTLKELKALKLNGSEHTIPTLKECLETVNSSVPLLIEFKSWNGNSKKLCQAANEILRHYDGKYWIQSFYPQVLHWYKKHNKHVFRGQLATKFSKMGFEKTLLGWMLFNFLGRPHFISYENTHGKALMFRFVLWLGASSAGWTYRSEKHLKETKTSFQAWIFEEFLPKS